MVKRLFSTFVLMLRTSATQSGASNFHQYNAYQLGTQGPYRKLESGHCLEFKIKCFASSDSISDSKRSKLPMMINTTINLGEKLRLITVNLDKEPKNLRTHKLSYFSFFFLKGKAS